jgi:OPT family small oligopeptide transporter
MENGLGLNPFPTFDWNILLFNLIDPLMVPFFNFANTFIGCLIATFVALGMWYTNALNTGYLPINSNHVFDHFGNRYNLSKSVDEFALFDEAKYSAYSPAYITAGNLTVYFFFFAIYTATISYAYLYHRNEIAMGFRQLFRSIIPSKNRAESAYEYPDIHNKLMKAYPEVPEWWYFSVLVLAIVFGCVGISHWQTFTSVGVVFFGVAMCLVFVVPIGIILSMTGVQVTLNVLAEFIGGSWVAGNALAMNFFKSFGYVTCATAIAFSNDLKLAHYVKIAPRHTFWAQIAATLVSTFVCTGVLNFQMNDIKNVCTPEAANHYTCPGINTFFTAAVLWGTVGPPKVFGKGGQYTTLLIGFPLGLVVPFIIYYAQKKFPKSSALRQMHPVVLFYGGIGLSPYNISYIWPAVPISWFSMVYLKKRYLAFWSKVYFSPILTVNKTNILIV